MNLMIKNLVTGISQGVGIGLGFCLVVSLYLWGSNIVTQSTPEASATHHISSGGTLAADNSPTHQVLESLFDKTVEEAISTSGVIAVVKYLPPTEDGLVRGKISSFLKAPTHTFPFQAGDEYPEAQYYLKPRESRGEMLIVFFAKNSNMSTGSAAVHNGKIPAFKHIPYNVFVQKVSNES